MAYRTAGRVSENVYTFTADASDNKARYKCEASNIMSKSPLKAEVDMSVLCKYEFSDINFLWLNCKKEIIKFYLEIN